MNKRIIKKIPSLQPFHHAFPVYDLEATRKFYVDTLGCGQGREAKSKWIDFNLFGHQIVAHKVPTELETAHRESRKICSNHVDGHAVPIPHFGCVLTWEQFNDFSSLLNGKVEFVIAPYVRFKGEPGEQQTMFFYDPSGNALEFKAFKDIDSQLFRTSK